MKYILISNYLDVGSDDDGYDVEMLNVSSKEEAIADIINMPNDYESWKDQSGILNLENDAGFTKFEACNDIRLLCVSEEIDMNILLKASKERFEKAKFLLEVSKDEDLEREMYLKLKKKYES